MSTPALSGMHILNTRPAQQAANLSHALREAGARVSELPLIAIKPRALPALEQRLLMELNSYQAVFFVSTNAAHYGLEAVANYWPQWPYQLPAYAVGEGTAAPLREAGLIVHLPESSDSEGLLSMPEWLHPANQRVLVMRGVGGRELLRETLRARGAHVDILELYQRELPDHAFAQYPAVSAVDAVILTSPDALRHWLLVAGDDATKPCWLVVSPRMRVLAEEAGATVCEALSADTPSIITALQSWAKTD